MSALTLASQLTGRPVVTLGGEAVARVKDTVFDGAGGQVTAFTLNGRGLLAGPLKQYLPWARVHGLGRDAVMIADETALVADSSAGRPGAGGGDVLGARVLSVEGVDLGRIVDVVIGAAATAEVIGYQIASTPALGHRRRKVFVPRAETMAVSSEALVVPAEVMTFIAEDLPGFEALERAFRSRSQAEG